MYIEKEEFGFISLSISIIQFDKERSKIWDTGGKSKNIYTVDWADK